MKNFQSDKLIHMFEYKKKLGKIQMTHNLNIKYFDKF